MKKTWLLILTVLCAFTFYLTLNHQDLTIVEAAVPANYYSGTENLSGNDLLNKLAEITKANHKTFTSYGDLRYDAKGNPTSDEDPNNPSNLLDFYTKISVKAAWDGGNTWNREHVWPQSLSGGLYGESGAGADVHHIRPTISSLNSSRGNKLFTDFDKIKATGSEKTYNGVLAAIQNGDYWEPIDDVKGDTARILMYLYMHYSNEVSSNSGFKYAGNLRITSVVYTDERTSDAAWDLLVEWSNLDPVDDFEANRNEFCAEVTGTRNPFIDNADFDDLIWGDGSGSQTPVTYKVSYNVGNATFTYSDNTEYKSGSKIAAPSSNPHLEGYTFDGWYTSSAYTTKWDFSKNTITSNLTLYAKFTKILSFSEVFESLKIKSQLTFDVDTIMFDIPVESEEKTITINQITAGEGSLTAGEYNLADYMTFDTSVFDIQYKANKAQHAYIKTNGQIRLYPGSGNGSSIEIFAKNNNKIKDVKVVAASDSAATPTITIASDGSSAIIKNTANATSGNQCRITGITITYETNGGMVGGAYYDYIPNSLYLNYVLQLTTAQYNSYLNTNKDIKMFIDGSEVTYDVVQLDGEYRLVYRIKITDINKVYIPKFTYDGIELTLTGYSGATLAQYYLDNLANDAAVKPYIDCLNQILG